MFGFQYNEDMQILRERVDNLREKRGWSRGQLHIQAQLHRPGLSRSTLYEALNNQRSPSLDVTGAIARALDTTVAYLIGETDDPAPKLNAREPLPAVRDWAERLRWMTAERQALTVRAMEAVMRLASSRFQRRWAEGSRKP